MRYHLDVHKSGSGGNHQLLQNVGKKFKWSNRVRTFPEVNTPQQREEWTHHTHSSVVTYMEDRNSDEEGSGMPPLISPEDSDDKEDNPCESLSNPPSAEPTLEPGSPSENPNNETTSEPDSDALS